MNYKPFSPELWKNIETTLSDLKSSNQKLIAAFDADGTLWDTDLGENFFNYQIDNKLVELPDNPFDHYLNLKKINNNDPRTAFLWLAQINEGKNIEQVRSWAEQAFNSIQPNPIFKDQKNLIDLLIKNDVEIYIVTASIKWAVEPGAVALGLKHENVIGVETAINNGLITSNAILPITYRQGKVDRLMQITNSIKPFLASGNTMGDYELLDNATHLKLAVSAASRDDRLFKTESELAQTAKDKKWMHHRFI